MNILLEEKESRFSRTDKIQSINFVPYAKISRFETLETGFRKEVSTPWNNNVLRYVSPENQSSRKEVIQVGRAKTWKIRAMHGLSSQFTPPSLYSKLVYIHTTPEEDRCFSACRRDRTYSWTYTHRPVCARIGRGLVGEGGEWEKEGRKIRKEGWLSDYSPLYMGAAGERGKGWNLLMAAIQPLPAPTPSSSLLHLSVGHLLLLLLFPTPGSPSPFPY